MYVEHRFDLADRFQDHLRSLIPPFGYNGFGEALYYRTYSRIKMDGGQEDWADTVIRNINGTFSIRKDFYVKNRIPWDEAHWQEYAQGFGSYLFNMKWMPPGRGLWAMGSDFVYERGSMALYNCAYTEMRSGLDFVDDVGWLMDSLMHGVGVGFGPLRTGLHFSLPTSGFEDHIIPDTREGWVESVQRLLLSYIQRRKYPRFIYDKIRGAGLPIKGFGGISSGPEALKYLHIKLAEECELFLHKKRSEVEFKSNVANLVGCCVVAGNVRRSAEIAIAPVGDKTFLDLKNYKKYPHRAEYGWMSNNSAIFDSDEDFDCLGEIARRVIHHGEPGIINLRNFRYGRIGRKKEKMPPDKATGINPCIPAWTNLITQAGLTKLVDVKERDFIWSSSGWTRVLKKWSTGIKKVFKYTTKAGSFYGTENHQIVSELFKLEIKDAESIDLLTGPGIKETDHDLQAIMDGLVVGDGTEHGGTILLNLGEKDLYAEVFDLIGDSYNKHYQYKVKTSITTLPVTYKRRIPESYFRATKQKVASFLRGLFSANGCINANRIELKASSFLLIEEVQLMLSSIGIASYWTKTVGTSVEFDNGVYDCRDSWQLAITKDRSSFARSVGFIQEYKTKALNELLEIQGNHKTSYEILSIEEIGDQEVWDITVDNHSHTFWNQGLNVSNCGEIPLEHREVCNLSETFPTMCDNPDEWYKACEYATFYSSTVSLLPTHQPSTNRVVARNRRIGVGLVDYSGWIWKEGVHKVTRYLRNGYDVVTESNRQFNAEAGVPESLRKTCVKPGGTTPKLPGRTSGAGNPTFLHTLRRIRVQQDTPYHAVLVRAGVPYEKDHYSMNTDVFEWPILQGPAPPAEDISIWEQAFRIVMLQREWSDNAVSNTIYFRPKWKLTDHWKTSEGVNVRKEIAELIGQNNVDKFTMDRHPDYEVDGVLKVVFVYDNRPIRLTPNFHVYPLDEAKVYEYDPRHEEDVIEAVLSMTIPHVKSLSLLPHTAKGVYKQMPEEGITEKEYEDRLEQIGRIDWSQLTNSDGQDERYCEGAACEVRR